MLRRNLSRLAAYRLMALYGEKVGIWGRLATPLLTLEVVSGKSERKGAGRLAVSIVAQARAARPVAGGGIPG
jgi:hypothetical protein